MRQSVAALAVLALLAAPATVSCAGTGPGPAEPPSSVPQSTPVPNKTGQIGQTLDLLRIGQQKIAVTLTQIVSPATVTNGWGEPGSSYAAVQLTIKNTGTTTIVGNSNSDVAVTGSDNQAYRADFATVSECDDFKYGWFLIAAGDTSNGCVVFKLPLGVAPAKVTYTPSSGISHDVGEWRTGL